MRDSGYIIQYLSVPFSHSRGLLRDVMPVHVVLCCVGIGIFNFRFFAKLNKSKFQPNPKVMEVSQFYIFYVLKSHAINSHCVIIISIALLHMIFSKLSQHCAYNARHKYGILWLLKIYLDSCVRYDD